ncbi:uncharacterized protein C8Q71DRAFT_787980 [Rhodofomes roseus]|uniref:Uncharacterized protein n=1 Tax=Rhodofomes roseus TaxID=34475 RepID=A0ABQ8K179_9APHY|nr:uncharacterized protein C8Q71DRAFT_787980 [Rhodofomes roseus]KAH9829939.1 hypothetical protein C8Q71DRAFT_787980 [Rhodofomes roseus]
MGNRRHASPKVVAEGRNMDLETELQSHAAHASQLQARLLTTLDKTDALRATHIQELAAERRAVNILSHKLDRCRKYIKEARAEWDDTREALSIVIEKVELANDYSLWPHSQMCMTAPLEPLSYPKASSSGAPLSEHPIHPFAKAIVASLREELEQERNAHAQTRARAEAEILSLNARLARRDAELEAKILRTADSHLSSQATRELSPLIGPRHSLQRNFGNSAPAPPLFSQEAAIQILDLAAARNRELEAEVHHLLERRDHARQSEHAHPARTHTGDTDKRKYAESNVSDALPEYRREDHDGVLTPISGPHAMQLDTQNTPVVHHREPLPHHIPTHGLAPPHSKLGSQGSSAESVTLVPPSTAIQQLQQLVGIFAAQLDGFSAERDVLKGALAAEHQDVRTEPREEAGPSHALDVDDEGLRLQGIVERLTHELSAVRESSQTREAHLQGQIAELRLEVSRMGSRESTTALIDPDETARVDAPTKIAKAGYGQAARSPRKPPDVPDDGGDECSMELATPLQPTILSVREDITGLGSAVLNPLPPPLIPLPLSPDSPRPPSSSQPRVPERLLPSIDLLPPLRDPPLWWPHPRSPRANVEDPHPGLDAALRLGIIERELALARQELEAKDAELSELRDIVGQLREVAYSGESEDEQDEAADLEGWAR